MRKLLSLLALAAVAGLGCQPRVLVLTATPSSVAVAPAKVKVYWKLSAGTAEMSADKPVKPVLVPKKPLDAEGEVEFDVCETTTFKVEPHYGGERTVTVTVAKPCGTACSSQTMTFQGTCFSAQQGPQYNNFTVSPNVVAGNIKDLISDADVPVHVIHNGQTIALGANGGPVFPPIPPMPAAGDYTILIPGAVGQKVCEDATGPVGGGQADAPEVHITLVPECPKP